MALHEEINDKSISVAARIGKLTADEIRKALDKILADMKRSQNKAKVTPERTKSVKRGKQTLKQLSKQNAGLSSVELKDPDLRLLSRTMKQNGVDFAPVKDGKGKYTVFFKGRDADALTHAFQQYTKKLTGKIKKPSISTTLSVAKQEASPATGRIHPDMLPLATETGRFASKNPNCQNMPRAGADDIGVRNFITAPEGEILLSLDFSQIELRVGAFYCKDQRMLETYQNGGDIHAQTTAIIYRIPLEEAADKNNLQYKERRTIAKNVNFGVFFGLYPKGLQKTLKFKAGLDVSLEECEKIIQNIKIGYPGLARWQEETKKRAAFRRYTETWLGRRRALQGIISPNWNVKAYAERCAMNTPIQGTAADILKLALGRILRGLPERPWLRPLLQIHDELVFELPENRVKEAAFFIKNCMEEKPFDVFSVPIIAEASTGHMFGDMKELDIGNE